MRTPVRGKRGRPGLQSAHPKRPPAPRRLDFEMLLCGAITNRRLVALRYESDPVDRIFQPVAVYHSTQHKVCVSGTQISNPAKPMETNALHDFEIGKIIVLRMTDNEFTLPVEFDSLEKKYRNGIICHVSSPLAARPVQSAARLSPRSRPG